MYVYKTYHQDCLSQQEAVGCINDAISVKANTVQFDKRMCRRCFPNWPFPSPRGSLSCFGCCLWWGREDCKKGRGLGDANRWDWISTLISTSSASLLSVSHIRLMEELPWRMHSRAKSVCQTLLYNGVMGERTWVWGSDRIVKVLVLPLN